MSPLERVELATGTNPAGTVIWMHGLGADGWDFVPIVRELAIPRSWRCASSSRTRPSGR